MYWICRPGKNKRHDLCVRQTSDRCDSEPQIPLLVQLAADSDKAIVDPGLN
jgi:hypothetical protein